MRYLNLKSKILILLVFISVVVFNCSKDDDKNDEQVAKPVLTIQSSPLLQFLETNELSFSASKSIVVNAMNLSSNVSLKTTTNFEVSIDNTDFSDLIEVDKSAFNDGLTVYIRFAPQGNAIGELNGVFTVTSSQAVDKTIDLKGTGVSIAPAINVSTTNLSFGDTRINTNSVAREIIVNGDNLVTDITVTAPSNFEISLDNVSFSNSIIIQANQVNNDKTVYVRFAPTEVVTYNEVLSFQNPDVANNVEVSLSGKGAPVIHNYVAFNNERLAFGGGFSQSATQTFNLHNNLSNIQAIKMYVKLRCPSGGCDEWDVFANVKVKDVASGEMYELGRYITPYWNDNSQLERGFEFDVTDFKSLLSGSTELRIRTECWNAKGYEVTVDFDYIEGTPNYRYSAISRVLAYDDWSSSGVPYGVANNFDLTRTISIPSNAEKTELRSIISGWGHATGNPGSNCAEWCFKTHKIKINGDNMFTHNLNGLDCASNPVNNQGTGNWRPDRAGWCPGMVVPIRIDEFNNSMAGTTFNFEYDYEDWTNNMRNGNAYYATSTFVVVKSNSPIVKPTVID